MCTTSLTLYLHNCFFEIDMNDGSKSAAVTTVELSGVADPVPVVAAPHLFTSLITKFATTS